MQAVLLVAGLAHAGGAVGSKAVPLVASLSGIMEHSVSIIDFWLGMIQLPTRNCRFVAFCIRMLKMGFFMQTCQLLSFG